jgi:hypothetical protein
VIVSFHRFAEQELNETAAYYERERAGLGVAFLAEAQLLTQSLSTTRQAKSLLAQSAVDSFGVSPTRFSTQSDQTHPHSRGDESQAASELLGRQFLAAIA